jgi:hypothetical protein
MVEPTHLDELGDLIILLAPLQGRVSELHIAHTSSLDTNATELAPIVSRVRLTWSSCLNSTSRPER